MRSDVEPIDVSVLYTESKRTRNVPVIGCFILQYPQHTKIIELFRGDLQNWQYVLMKNKLRLIDKYM